MTSSQATRRAPTLGMKLGLAAAGVLVVLLAFGILTALRRAARSMGKLPHLSAAPGTPVPAGTVSALRMPSQALTVTLDAGRAPP